MKIHKYLGVIIFAAQIAALALGASDCSDGVAEQTAKAKATIDSLESAGLTDTRRYEPASIDAPPGASCILHPDGSADPSESIPVFVDDDGIARFYAVRPSANEASRTLVLDCHDTSGTSSSYVVDLHSESIFERRPFDLKKPGIAVRPALRGDPMQYSIAELLQAGYGLRPDPITNPTGYSSWLKAVSIPVHPTMPKHVDWTLRFTTTFSQGNSVWAGPILFGQGPYAFAQADIYLGVAVPGGDGTRTPLGAIWAGLGGYGDLNHGITQGALIQAGTAMQTTTSTASYFAWHEYCCGESPTVNNNGVIPIFQVNPGDEVYTAVWACSATFAQNVNGGYGCFQIQDNNNGQSTVTQLPMPTAQQGAPFNGATAEFIYERVAVNGGCNPANPCPEVPYFDVGTYMTGCGAANQNNSGFNFNSTNELELLTMDSAATRMVTPTIQSANQVYFNFNPRSE